MARIFHPQSLPPLPPFHAGDSPLAFHRNLPGYQATPLREVPNLARRLGLGRVFVKDECQRFGLPAFKILGASWATWRALHAREGKEPQEVHSFEEMARRFAHLRPFTLAAATDGNHGRAVARMAKLLGFSGRIFVPSGTAEARIAAILSEGASCEVVEGTYDDAVARAAREQGERCQVIADTAWEGYEEVPGWVMDGYSTILAETDASLAAVGETGFDLVVVQIGVGALAAAVAQWYRRPGLPARPRLMGVEPERAACALAAVEAGRIVAVPGPHHSIMAGLNCGEVSPLAWPWLRSAFSTFAAIEDDLAREGMRILAGAGIESGETGAAGVGGLLALLEGTNGEDSRQRLNLGLRSRVLLFSTEGATDPQAWRDIVGPLGVQTVEELRGKIAF